MSLIQINLYTFILITFVSITFGWSVKLNDEKDLNIYYANKKQVYHCIDVINNINLLFYGHIFTTFFV